MLIIPFNTSSTKYSIFICLKDENIERIKEYDPAEIVVSKFGQYSKLKLEAIIIGYATDEEESQLINISKDQVPESLKNLSRGFKFCPKRGDEDGPYQSIKEN